MTAKGNYKVRIFVKGKGFPVEHTITLIDNASPGYAIRIATHLHEQGNPSDIIRMVSVDLIATPDEEQRTLKIMKALEEFIRVVGKL